MAYRTTRGKRRYQRKVRERNWEEGRCINDTIEPSHGPLVTARRCAECVATHRRSW